MPGFRNIPIAHRGTSATAQRVRTHGKLSHRTTLIDSAGETVGAGRLKLENPNEPIRVNSETVLGVHERRRRRRVAVPPMYTSAIVRLLSQRLVPLEGHVLDVSENGIAIEVDSLIAVGQAVTIEFRVAGMGAARRETWPEFAAAAEVVRHDNLEDFPHGPYRIALRFIQVSTMTQAQIARFAATHAGR